MATGLWTDTETEFIKNNLSLPTKDIFTAFQSVFGIIRTYDSVQKKVKDLRGSLLDSSNNQDLTNQLEQGITVDALADALDHVIEDLEGTIKGEQSTKEVDSFTPTDKETVNQIIKWLSDTSESFKPSVSDKKLLSDKPSLVLLLSDLHFGKMTENFNLEEAKRRIKSIPNQLLNIPEVDEIVVCLVGDIVDGEDIYAHQNGEIEVAVITQAQTAVESIWQLLLDLREKFKCKVRVETAPGNHGRMSKTADPRSNWDNVCYMMLAEIAKFKGDTDIEVNLNFDSFRIFDVKGKTGMAYHYGTKHLGTPSMQVKYAGWIVSHNVDFIVHGHWHHWSIETYLGRPMISNGSLPGPDDLSRSMAVEEPPRQAYFLVSKDMPLTGFSFIEW